MYGVAARIEYLTMNCPRTLPRIFAHHLKVVHQFLFRHVISPQMQQDMDQWRQPTALVEDTRCFCCQQFSNSPKRRFQDRTAECPICFETLWTATPTAFVKLVEGQLPHAMHAMVLKTSFHDISTAGLLCLALRSAAQNQKFSEGFISVNVISQLSV